MISLLSSVVDTPLVQLVERRFPKPDVEGSSPSGRDRYSFFVIYVVSC